MRSKKRIFIGLICLSLMLIIGLIIFTWQLFFNSSEPFQLRILAGVTLSAVFFIIILTVGIAGLVISLLREKNIPPALQNIILFAVNFLFPVALSMGRAFKIDEQKIKSSFIEVNNQLVLAKKITVEPHKIIILAPHCLQKADCPYKITIDVNNCRRCGKCPISDLHKIAEKYKVSFYAATGGSLARKIIRKSNPQAVVAIACERDLTSGIKDSRMLPVLGVLNIRPEGPCYNTTVNLNNIENAIEFFLNK